MSARTLMLWLAVVAAVVTMTLAMHGHGHRSLARWFASVHGGAR